MNRPPILHLKAALLCALGAIVLALPLVWLPSLPGMASWWPAPLSPRVEAVLAVVFAGWVAWCVVDIPRRGLKILIWGATLWLLVSGLWLGGLYGWPVGWWTPAAAVGLAGAGALAFSFSPAGSRQARWASLVGARVAPEVRRAGIDERDLPEGPQESFVVVAEVLWPVEEDWTALSRRSAGAARHLLGCGGYLERVDGEGARVVFGLWGKSTEAGPLLDAVWSWVSREGGCAALARGVCRAGVGEFPTGARWTLNGAPLRRAARMASMARAHGARLLVEDGWLEPAEGWISRRVAWGDFEGERVLLREVVGTKQETGAAGQERVRRWERAWEAFWQGDWAVAEDLFTALAREGEDAAARIFALRSAAARHPRRDP